VPITVLQRAQMTQIGAHHGRHRLTCRLRQIGGAAFGHGTLWTEFSARMG
jgi:hypothetical protein